ncbi:hypothetical protein BDV93DRAFT_544640 [Ceratobasidium sp. AG-I]|nr:hypothetical protein BDV93DRAFT_544640 [Ceratobasidium sp. AG-I]
MPDLPGGGRPCVVKRQRHELRLGACQLHMRPPEDKPAPHRSSAHFLSSAALNLFLPPCLELFERVAHTLLILFNRAPTCSRSARVGDYVLLAAEDLLLFRAMTILDYTSVNSTMNLPLTLHGDPFLGIAAPSSNSPGPLLTLGRLSHISSAAIAPGPS